MLKDMGASWAVEYFPWDQLQPKGPDHYDWSHTDLVIANARKYGIRLIARIDAVPQWARPSGTTSKYLDEAHYVDYANFVSTFAQRYQGSVDYIVVWNEPNLSFEWGFRPVDPAGYVRLLSIVYRAVKAAAPGVRIAFAGLAPTNEPPGSPVGLSDLSFLEQAYQAGASQFSDAIAVHSYGLNLPPSDPPESDKINFRRTELLHRIALQHGDGAKPFLITEGGWNDSKRWIYGVTPAQRVRYTVEAYDMAWNNWPWLQAMCLWAFRFVRPTYTYQDSYTFVDFDFEPKPIYEAIRDYVHGASP